MKPLQAWADKGALIFPCDEYPNGAVKKDGRICHTYMIHEHLQLVLDGTIQVWRPVGKYDPIFDAELYLCLGKDGEQYIGDITYFEEKKGATRSYCVVLLHNDFSDHKTYLEITHYQPLPQPPQEVSDATD
jgi:hypothetical protein